MPGDWRTLRVFVSSTFRDMQAERDWLVRFVFPRLRQELLPRRIRLVDVDLRWGVTAEQNALDVCREIIDECRPRFLCLLGGRYGWVPPGRQRSITAEEIQYAVLDRLGHHGLAYFYFRQDDATAAIVEETPGDYREPPGTVEAHQLELLKRTIADAGLNPFEYPARWDPATKRVVGLADLGERVFQDLLRGVAEELGPAEPGPPGELDAERAAMDAFIDDRAAHFVAGSRDHALAEAVAFAESETGRPNILLITGAPGSGKSAALSRLCLQLGAGDTAAASRALVIPHFAGASAGSTDLRRMVRRLCLELQSATGGDAPVPDDKRGSIDRLAALIRQVSATRQVAFVIDGVDQFDAADEVAALQWLPGDLPPSFRVVLSAAIGGVAETIVRVRHQQVSVRPLDALIEDDAREIVRQFAQRYGKTFDDDQIGALLAKPQSDTPLYLLVALEELRTFGGFERISQAIRDLPGDVGSLFAWILSRLSGDPDFRDADGLAIGGALVRDMTSRLAISRHGLSVSELTDLLDPGDPIGNVSALTRLLRPYLMWRGDLLTFHHAQLREAVQRAYLQSEDDRRAAHAVLADYFRRRAATPSGTWREDRRPLAELPVHLAGAGREEDLEALLTQLAYLAPRVATGEVYEVVEDYARSPRLAGAAAGEWRDFLHKHAQRLAVDPDMLVALAYHEGSAIARRQAAEGSWTRPWLKTSVEPMPPDEEPGDPSQPRITTEASFEWHYSRPSAIAADVGWLLSVESLGVVTVADVRTMQSLGRTFAVRAERVLVVACSPQATSVALFFESGRMDLYRAAAGADGLPASLDLAATLPYRLPEFDDPVAIWRDDTLWFQRADGRLARVDEHGALVSAETIGESPLAELSALVFAGARRFIAVHQNGSTILRGDSPADSRPATDEPVAVRTITSACHAGGDRVAVAVSDGTVQIRDLSRGLALESQVQSGMIRGALGWDGERAIWLTETQKLTRWLPGSRAPTEVRDDEELFPLGLHVSPRAWLPRSDGSLIVLTSHNVARCRLAQGAAGAAGRIESLFGGATWRVVRRSDNRSRDWWLAEGQSPRQRLLGRGVKGRLYTAPDGAGHLFAASGYGPGLMVELANEHATPLEHAPMAINMAAGDPDGGCWLVDRQGDIYFADEAGRCHLAARIDLESVTGARLQCCGDHVVWFGHTSRYFPESGYEPARTLVFFKRTAGARAGLERLGHQALHPREGICEAICYDAARRRLVTVWAAEGKDTYRLRLGTVDDFLAWRVDERDIDGLDRLRFQQAALAPDPRWLGMVSAAGDVVCVDVDRAAPIARLSASLPFTAIATGVGATAFWLVQSRARVYGCEIVRVGA